MEKLEDYFTAQDYITGETFAEYIDRNGYSTKTAIRAFKLAQAIQPQPTARTATTSADPAAWWCQPEPQLAQVYWWSAPQPQV